MEARKSLARARASLSAVLVVVPVVVVAGLDKLRDFLFLLLL